MHAGLPLTPPGRDSSSDAWSASGLLALVLVGLTLRPQLTLIGPILPRIQEEVAIFHAAAGLLTGLPLLCMGLAAFSTSRIVARLGTTTTVGLALALVGVAGVARAAAPGVLLIFVATLFIGIGIGIGGASAPVFVKERLSHRPATATGAHVTAIILGSVVAASTAIPIAQELGSWRWPLAVSSVATLVAALAWVVLTAGPAGSPRRASTGRSALPWRRPIAWLLVVVFCGQSLVFFGLATWLPAAYIERGWSEPEAANLVAVLILFGLPASLGVGWLSDRFGSRRHYLVASAATSLICCLGFILLPDAGLLWAAAIGLALGALFALVLTLPLDASSHPADVGPLTGLMLGVGYLVAAAAPVAMGAARDLVGSFTTSLGLLALASAVLLGVSMLLTNTRLASGRRAESSPGARPIGAGGESL